MEKIINNSMIHDVMNNAPTPRPSSLLLAVAFWTFHFMGTITHSEVNLWLATAVSVFAAIRYMADFIKWFKNRK